MARTKGTQKTGGRGKNTPNKISAEMKGKIQLFVENNFLMLQKDFEAVEAKDRLIIFERLLKYVIPAKVENETINPIDQQETIHISIGGEHVDLCK